MVRGIGKGIGLGAARGLLAGVALSVVLRLLAEWKGVAVTLPPLWETLLGYGVAGAAVGILGGLAWECSAILLRRTRFAGRIGSLEPAAFLGIFGAVYAGMMTYLLAVPPAKVFMVGNTAVSLLYVLVWVGVGIVLSYLRPATSGAASGVAYVGSLFFLWAALASAFWFLHGEGWLLRWRPSPLVDGAIHVVLLPLVALAAFGIERVLAEGLRRLLPTREVLRAAGPGMVALLALLVLAILPGIRGGREGAPSVLLLVLESVRADAVLTLEGDERTTPALDSLAAEGAVFRRALAPANWCLPSMVSLFTGAVPSRHGAHGADPGGFHEEARGDSSVRTLAEQFSEAGYRTALFHDSRWLNGLTGASAGYEEEIWAGTPLPYILEPRALFHVSRAPVDFHVGATERTIRAAGNWMSRQRGRPFFATVHLGGAASPYLTRAPWKTKYTRGRGDPAVVEKLRRDPLAPQELRPKGTGREDLEELRALYLGAVSYVDGQLGALVERLRKEGLLDGTVVVVTSDHGENFGWGGLLSHFFAVNEGLVHVPLLIRYPERVRAGMAIDGPVSLLDVAPTLLEIAGISPPLEVDGVSLLGPLAEGEAPPGRGIPSEAQAPWFLLEARSDLREASPGLRRDLMAWRSGDLKLILASDGTRWLYDLAVDPEEFRNSIEDAAYGEAAARLAREADAWRASLPEEGPLTAERLRRARIAAMAGGFAPSERLRSPEAAPPPP